MLRNKAALAVATALATALCSSIAAAQADSSSQGATGATGATGTATPATITVNGSASISLPPTASSGAITSGYMSALAVALADAHSKAGALAAGVGDTLGAVENVTEQSSDSNLCSGPGIYARAVPSVAPAPKKHKGRHPTKAARIADATTPSCTVEADVTVTYAMS